MILGIRISKSDQHHIPAKTSFDCGLPMSIGGRRELRRTEALDWDGSADWQRSRIFKLALSPPSAQDNELREIYSSDVPRFGPFYGGDEMVVWTGKEDAWEHVLMEFPGVDADTTTKAYLSAVKRIEKQARETYAVAARDHEAECLLNGPRFRRMMVKDACFILQLVLFSLGGHLGYEPNHPIFGETRNTRHMRRWLHALFFVGNQIPLVVLHELMKQPFFKRVLEGRKWKPPLDLMGRTLFELLVRPFLEPGWSETMKGLFWAFCRTGGRAASLHRLEPSDILNGLHLLVVGPGSGIANEDEDEDEYGDLSDDEEDGGGGDDPNVGRWSKIHCATELDQMGIHFRNAGEVGTGGIRFKETMFCAVLLLPALQVDADAELVFRYLRNYEVSQQLGRSRREVCAYLQFMSELIQTPEDARVLAAKGIVRAAPKEKEKLAAILSKVARGETNQKLRLVRLQIHDYSKPPWDKIKNFLSLVLLLTVVQTVYTVMTYYK